MRVSPFSLCSKSVIFSILKLLLSPFTFACKGWEPNSQILIGVPRSRASIAFTTCWIDWRSGMGHGMLIDFGPFWENRHCKSWKPLSSLSLSDRATWRWCSSAAVYGSNYLHVLTSHLRFWTYAILLCTSHSWPYWQNESKITSCIFLPFSVKFAEQTW